MKPLTKLEVQNMITALLLAHPELKEDEILRADMIEAETPTVEFLSMMVAKIGEAEAMTKALDARIDEIKKRRDRIDGRIIGLKSLVMKIMATADLKTMRLAEATVTVKQGQPRVIVVDDRLIPAIFCRIRKEPDKRLIKSELESGGAVLGCVLSNAEPVLQVTT